jgi:hypothetical protein
VTNLVSLLRWPTPLVFFVLLLLRHPKSLRLSATICCLVASSLLHGKLLSYQATKLAHKAWQIPDPLLTYNVGQASGGWLEDERDWR